MYNDTYTLLHYHTKLFYYPKNASALSIHPSPIPNPTPCNRFSFYSLHSVAFLECHIWCSAFSNLLSSLSIQVFSMSSHGLIHHFFLLLNNSPLSRFVCLFVQTDIHSLYICSSIEGHLDLFQLLIIINTVAINIPMQVCVWARIFGAFG